MWPRTVTLAAHAHHHSGRTVQNIPAFNALRACEAFLATEDNLPERFDAYVALAKHAAALSSLPSRTKTMVLPDVLNYPADGEVLRLWLESKESITGATRFITAFSSPSGAIITNLMYNQPPKNIGDGCIVDGVLAAIPLIDHSTQEIGFTSGEPTLLGDDFFEFCEQ